MTFTWLCYSFSVLPDSVLQNYYNTDLYLNLNVTLFLVIYIYSSFILDDFIPEIFLCTADAYPTELMFT